MTETVKPETRAVVYQYATDKRTRFDDEAMRQLRMAHNFWNSLVAIWYQHRDRKLEAWRSIPKIDKVWAKLEELEVKETEAFQQWQKSKVETQDRKGDEACRQALDEVRKEIREARSTLNARKKDFLPELRQKFADLKKERWAAEKLCRQEYSAQGLYWGTYNRVAQNYQRAASAAEAKWEKGQSAFLRFQKWEGEGTLSVQLQRQSDDPERNPSVLASTDGKWKGQVLLPEMVEAKQWAPLKIRTGVDENGKAHHSTIEGVRYHRPIPEEGDLTDVAITRRKKTRRSYEITVENTVKLPAPMPSTAPGVVGIDTGWRVLPDGSIRVAVWRAKENKPLVVPHHLVDAIVLEGEGGEVRIPAKYVAMWREVHEIQGRRDRALELMKEQLIKRWPQIRIPHYDDPPKEISRLADVTIKNIQAWRSPSRFSWLTYILAKYNMAGAQFLTTWDDHDAKLEAQQEKLRRKVINWRKDCFRVVGASLAKQNHLVVVEKPFVAKVIKKTETDTHADDATRVPSVVAAPATLTLFVQQACAARGVTFETKNAKGTTLKHTACGYTNPVGSGAKSIMIKCEGCGESYDQDVNSAWTLIN